MKGTMHREIKKCYTYAVIATDTAVFTIIDDTLNVLLMKMKKRPYENAWALPGGLVGGNESLEDAAKRQLLEKADVKTISLEQLNAFGRIDRDPFGRVVSVAYTALVRDTAVEQKEGIILWHPVKKLPFLAYDHKEMIAHAIKHLQTEIQHTALAKNILPHEFTLTELQRAYEIILGKKIDKRNFRKKLFVLGLVKKTRRKKIGRPQRPAQLYRFKAKP